MSRLYPPITEEVLSAFCLSYNDQQEKVGASINVSFNLNRAVAISEIGGIALRLRTISTNQYVITENINKNEETGKSEGIALSYDLDNGTAVFQITETNNSDKMKFLNVGQYYKAQIAFIDLEGNIGYWSTVSTIKCVAKPSVSIANFTSSDANVFMNEIVGEYVQDTVIGDSSEKVYSYRFQLWDVDDNLIEDTGIQLHNSSADISGNTSTDIYYCYKNLNEDEIYYIEYSVTTINGLNVSSPRYQIINMTSIDPEEDIILVAQNGLEEDYEQNNNWFPWEEGIIKLYIDFNKIEDRSNGKTLTGNFIILRSSSKDNFGSWQEIRRFRLSGDIPSRKPIYDYTVEQGINYKYAVQQFNKQGFYSKKVYSYIFNSDGTIKKIDGEPVINILKADFEDMFLYDGERQLKIRFNPKVSSFKNDLQEQKIDTIGSKHPFIFRNGNVLYKEFPISGLLSFQLDNSRFFMTDEDYNQMELSRFEIPKDELQLRSRAENINYRYTPITSFRTITENNYTPLYIYIQNEQTNVYTTDLYHENLRYKPVEQTITKNYYKQIATYEEARNLFNNNNTLYKKVAIQNNSTYKDIYRGETYNKNDLTSENITSERYFKLSVLDWLTDGKPKLFRSPTEGNYIVRLLNVNLSPKAELGRMLHEFTCTAYEIADFNYVSLVNLGLLSVTNPQKREYTWVSYNIKDLFDSSLITSSEGDQYYMINLEEKELSGFSCSGFAPGDKIRIVIADQIEPIIITIGQTGSYIYENSKSILSLGIMPQNNTEDFPRSFLLALKGYINQGFDTIASMSTHTIIGEQYVGKHDDIFQTMIVGQAQFEKAKNLNLTENGGIKTKVSELLYLHAKKREIIPIFLVASNDNQYNLDNDIAMDKARFALTPFGNGYIQYKTELKTIGTRFTTDIEKLWIKLTDEERSKMMTIKNLVEFSKNKLQLDNFCLFEVYIPIITGETEPVSWIPYSKAMSNRKLTGIFDPYLYNYEIENNSNINYTTGWWLSKQDPNDFERYYPQTYDPFFTLGYEDEDTKEIYYKEISLQDSVEITLQNIKVPISLTIENGVVIEIIYRTQVIDYGIETENSKIKSLKNIYLETKNDAIEKMGLYRTWLYSKMAGEILYDKYSRLAAEIKDYSNYQGVVLSLTNYARNRQNNIIKDYLTNELNLVTNILLQLQTIDLDLKESLGEEYENFYSFYSSLLAQPKSKYDNKLNQWLSKPVDELMPSIDSYVDDYSTPENGYNDVKNKISSYLNHIEKSSEYDFFDRIQTIKTNLQRGYNDRDKELQDLGTYQYMGQYLEYLQKKGSDALLSNIPDITFFGQPITNPIGQWVNKDDISDFSPDTKLTSSLWEQYFHIGDNDNLPQLGSPSIVNGKYEINNLDKYITLNSNYQIINYNTDFYNNSSLLFTTINSDNKNIMHLITNELSQLNSTGSTTEDEYERTWGMEFISNPQPAGLELKGNGIIELGIIPSDYIILKTWLETIVDAGFIENKLYNNIINQVDENGNIADSNEIYQFLNGYSRFNTLPKNIQKLICQSIFYYLTLDDNGFSIRDYFQSAYTIYAYWQEYENELSDQQVSIIKTQILYYKNLIESSKAYKMLYTKDDETNRDIIGEAKELISNWKLNYDSLFNAADESENSYLTNLKTYIANFNTIIQSKNSAIDEFLSARTKIITLEQNENITVSDNIKNILWEEREKYREAYEEIDDIYNSFINQYQYIQSLAQYTAYMDFLKSYLTIISTNPYNITMTECQQQIQQALAMKNANINEEYNLNNQQKRINIAYKNYLNLLANIYKTDIEGRFD